MYFTYQQNACAGARVSRVVINVPAVITNQVGHNQGTCSSRDYQVVLRANRLMITTKKYTIPVNPSRPPKQNRKEPKPGPKTGSV